MSDDKNYIFSTSIETTDEQDEFLLELFSCSDEGDEHIVRETTIHNFEELIAFFEKMEQEQEQSCE